ncbi:MAG: HD domain-containing protein [Armatimonadetes bacterium]|nr:HD domain-containing protein [Armatimonadota bacterium]
MTAEGLDDILRRLEQAADPNSLELVRQAYELAQALHKDQRRKDGSTIFEHVLGVTRKVVQYGGRSPELVAAALLHDAVENTDFPLDEISRAFGAKVAHLVDALTNRPEDDEATPVQRAVRAGSEAILLRLCDRLDGLERVAARPEKTRLRFLTATRQHYLRLAEEHYPEIAAAMRQAIEAAEAGPSGPSREISRGEER